MRANYEPPKKIENYKSSSFDELNTRGRRSIQFILPTYYSRYSLHVGFFLTSLWSALEDH